MHEGESVLSGPLGREQLIELFEELSSELARRGARAHVYVFGGAAMSVAFDRRRTTVAREALAKVFERDLGYER